MDLDWIESISAPLTLALAAIEAAAEPNDIPIVDRDAGRVLSVLAGSRRRIVEVGTAYGYSTLWMALGQPADGTIVTIDPDRARRTWPAAGGARRGSPTSGSRSSARPPRGPCRGASPRWPARSTSRFIDALKPEYEAYLAALVAAARARCPGRRRQRPVERTGSQVPGRSLRDDTNTNALRAFDQATLADPRFTCHDPARRRRPPACLLARLKPCGKAPSPDPALRLEVQRGAVRSP